MEIEEPVSQIEGLKELYEAISAARDYTEAFKRMMDDESNDGVFPPVKPAVSPAEISAKYPRAAAYVKAETWSYAANYVKADAGRKALEAIINGAEPEATIKEMEAEWTAYCLEHIWD